MNDLLEPVSLAAIQQQGISDPDHQKRETTKYVDSQVKHANKTKSFEWNWPKAFLIFRIYYSKN